VSLPPPGPEWTTISTPDGVKAATDGAALWLAGADAAALACVDADVDGVAPPPHAATSSAIAATIVVDRP